MTLKEAIESERPFKRPMYDRWLVLFQGNLYREVWFNDGKLYPQHGISEASPVLLLISAAIANDWEVKP